MHGQQNIKNKQVCVFRFPKIWQVPNIIGQWRTKIRHWSFSQRCCYRYNEGATIHRNVCNYLSLDTA